MEKSVAIKLIEDTFESSFNKDKFSNFVNNLFNHIDRDSNIYTNQHIPDTYKEHIQTFECIGRYKDEQDKQIDILIVNLNKESSIERARTMQRNFIAWYLNSGQGRGSNDIALAAFVSSNSDDWRFSLVKMEYNLYVSNDKLRAKRELTPAKRFSFLVGKNENTHTAQQQFLPILSETDRNPLCSEIEEAFSVEKVTKDFYEKYRALYENLSKALRDDKSYQKYAEKANLNTPDFAKKVLGQIVFLYFLQKKGWLGVPKEKSWGEGDKKFMRNLFNNCISNKKCFYNDYLEHLFYDTLNNPQRRGVDPSYSDRFNCRIPFLNGGLFEEDYEWRDSKGSLINIDNSIFSEKSKNGNGILDVFDRYNFTVKEDEPLEKEVAVDPEMLGKVFENLLEVKDRKAKGTYYTPREIVHHMCQESLITYLDEELNHSVSKSSLKDMFVGGEMSGKLAVGKRNSRDICEYQLPEDILRNANVIDIKLANIKICDPAVGSGAFLVSIMHEIVKVRSMLSSHIEDGDRSIYKFKLNCILESLYGVDIDPGAVEIAKLRLWLSLIVDENDITDIRPLPNLDYKIKQGDSLTEEYKGIKLFDEDIIFPKKKKSGNLDELKRIQINLQNEYIQLYNNNKLEENKKQELEAAAKEINNEIKKYNRKTKRVNLDNDLFDDENAADNIAEELKRLHKEYFAVCNKSQKSKIKDRINSLEWKLIEKTLLKQNKIAEVGKLQKYKMENTKPFFIWKLYFNEVFHYQGGFDIVIANPPYVFARDKGFTKEDKEYYYKQYLLADYQLNTYVMFIERAISILKNKGCLSFIIPNNWMTIGTCSKFRKYLLKNMGKIQVTNIIGKVFEEASVDNSLLQFIKSKPDKINLNEYVDGKFNTIGDYSPEIFNNVGSVINLSLAKNKGKIGILHKIEKKSIKLGECAKVSTGLKAYQIGKGKPSQTEKIKKGRVFHSDTKKDKTYKKYLNGRDVIRYRLEWTAGYLSYGQWLAEPRESVPFKGPRILVRQIPSLPPYSIQSVYVEEEYLNDINSMNVFNFSEDPLLILAALNSRATTFWFKNTFDKFQRKIFPQFKVKELQLFPIPIVTGKQKKDIIKAAEEILYENKQIKCSAKITNKKIIKLNEKIDNILFDWYEITPSEINTLRKDTE